MMRDEQALRLATAISLTAGALCLGGAGAAGALGGDHLMGGLAFAGAAFLAYLAKRAWYAVARNS